MNIREATVGDVPELFELRCSVRENHMSRAQLAAVGITPESVAAMISGGDYVTPVAEADGRVVAFAMGRVSEAYVFAVFVRPEYEGRGFGGAVLASLERSLRERGVTRAWLATGHEAWLRAHGFYQARGWTAMGRREDGQMRYEKTLG